MQSIQDIYESKLEMLYHAAKEGAARLGTGSNVFSDILSAIEDRLGLESTSSLSDSDDTSAEIDTAIERAAQAIGLDDDLIRAVIQAESDYDPFAISCCGARGLMQLMPGTAQSLGVFNSFDVQENVTGGTAYLKEQISNFGDLRLALAAYNAGPAKIGSLNITDPDDPEQYSRISSGVRSYVDTVLSNRDQFIDA